MRHSRSALREIDAGAGYRDGLQSGYGLHVRAFRIPTEGREARDAEGHAL